MHVLIVFIPEVIFACYAALREERKTGCLSGKGMNESFKYEEENIVKDEDLTPNFRFDPELPCFSHLRLATSALRLLNPLRLCVMKKRILSRMKI